MNAPRETWDLGTRHVGRTVLVFDSLASTNDLAAELGAEAPSTVVLAGHQTAGRGQYGRSWISRPGASLLMSVVVAPPVELRRPVVLTAWAAVGVARAVADLTGQQAAIKWPNDLLIHGKKVCGILIEQRAGMIVGIGLNLNQSVNEFAATGLPEATSLAALTDHPFELRPTATAVIGHLDNEYDRFMQGDLADLERDWSTRLGLTGREVRIDYHNGTTTFGRLQRVSFAGVELHAEPAIIRPEHVRALRAL